jgi:hypothetical protein
MRYCIDVGYPFDSRLSDEDFYLIAAAYGDQYPEDAGGGFSVRDMQWYVSGRKNAEAFADEFRTLMAEQDDFDDWPEGTAYVVTYWMPKSYMIDLIFRQRDFKELFSYIKERIRKDDRTNP